MRWGIWSFGLVGLVFCLVACQAKSNGKAEIDMLLDTTRLESEDAYLAMLFFDDGLAEVVERLKNLETDWAKSFRDAYDAVQAGDNETAIWILRSIADDRNLEIGLRLWAWSGLRDLGVSPEDATVYGYILEVPNDQTIEKVAIYNDGIIRYLHDESVFGWEILNTEDLLNRNAIETIQLVQDLVDVGAYMPEHLRTIPSAPRLSLLTFKGLVVIDFSTNETLEFWDASTELLELLIPRAREALDSGGNGLSLSK